MEYLQSQEARDAAVFFDRISSSPTATSVEKRKEQTSSNKRATVPAKAAKTQAARSSEKLRKKAPKPASRNTSSTTSLTSKRSPSPNERLAEESPGKTVTKTNQKPPSGNKKQGTNPDPNHTLSPYRRTMETESPMEATGSQNRDEHPIPKEIVTPTIPYSQLLAREEEDEILGPGTTATPSPTTPDKVQQLKAEVVEHCRDMRKSLMSMTKEPTIIRRLQEKISEQKSSLRDSVRMCSRTFLSRTRSS